MHIAARDDLRARFEREARAVSSLSHPLLHCGPLPLDQTLKYAMQTADGVYRAHRSGVVHRDLKPGNIIITRYGVKVLDFGLAKTTPKSAADGATMTMAVTSEGTVPGTPRYMRPSKTAEAAVQNGLDKANPTAIPAPDGNPSSHAAAVPIGARFWYRVRHGKQDVPP